MCRIALLVFALLAFAPVHAAEPEDVQGRIFAYFVKRATEGDMNSQFIVGSRYENGTGVAKDMEKAYQWYAKAAEQGHPLAQQKMEDHLNTGAKAEKAKENAAQQHAKEAQVREQAAKTHEQAIQAAKAREQAAKTAAREQPAKTAPAFAKTPEPVMPTKAPQPVAKAPEPVIVTKSAAKEPAETPINTLDIVLKGSWKRNQSPAEYLPSIKASCLQASDAEVVCFSEELQRVVGASALTYTVKSTLTNFANDGSFYVNYVYNVVNIDTAKSPAPNQDRDGPSDLAVKLGWQEPGRRLECKAGNEKTVTCIKDKKYSLQFVN